MTNRNRFLTASTMRVMLLCAAMTLSTTYARAQQIASRREPSAAASAIEQEAVRDLYLRYKAAILNGSGTEAQELVDERTLKYYAEMSDLALNAPEAKVRSLSFVNKTMVLMLRHRTETERLRAMSPREIVAFAVDNGMIGKDSVLKSGIGKITIFAGNARGEFLLEGKPTPLAYRFTKENGEWKIDLTALLLIAEASMKTFIQREKLDEDEFLFTLLEITSGRKPAETIWQPLLK